jgi:hypothetical protein
VRPRKCIVRTGYVYAYAQDLGVGRLEFGIVLFEGPGMVRSRPTKGKEIEEQHHRFLALELA